MDHHQDPLPDQPGPTSDTGVRTSTHGRKHIPLYPRGYVAVPTLQLIFAIIVLGLSAYVINEHPTRGGPPPGFGLSVFTSLVTIITAAFFFISYYTYARAYNYWALLGLDIFNLIFWVISFAFVANATGDLHKLGSVASLTDKGKKIYAAGVATAIFGAFCSALFIVSLAIHSTILHRHRAAGGHSEAGMPERSISHDGHHAKAPLTADQQTKGPATPMRNISSHQQSPLQQQPPEIQPATGSNADPDGALPLQNEYVMSQTTGSSYYGGSGEQSRMGTGTHHQLQQQSYPEMNPHEQQHIPQNINPEYEGYYGNQQQQQKTEEYQQDQYSTQHGTGQPIFHKSAPQHGEVAELS